MANSDRGVIMHDATGAALRLMCWRDVAAWIDHAALEFTADATTRAHLEHVAMCVRDEAERRYAARAGLEPAQV